jgi:toxin YoeB
MNLTFTEHGWEEYEYWQHNDPRMIKKIGALIRECRRTPYFGTGKPEALRGNWSGWWSRRITDEHRLVYRIEGEELIIAQCRWHYTR